MRAQCFEQFRKKDADYGAGIIIIIPFTGIDFYCYSALLHILSLILLFTILTIPARPGLPLLGTDLLNTRERGQLQHKASRLPDNEVLRTIAWALAPLWRATSKETHLCWQSAQFPTALTHQIPGRPHPGSSSYPHLTQDKKSWMPIHMAPGQPLLHTLPSPGKNPHILQLPLGIHDAS